MNQFISIESSSDVTPIFSVVICSVDFERYMFCRDNIISTIGVSIEFVRINNKEAKWPIAKAYNNGAKVATAPNLLFIHEDVMFESSNWGVEISNKLADTTTGVIGFIGSPFRLGSYSGWCEHEEHAFGHMYYIKNGERIGWHKEPWQENGTIGESFAPVLVVDGLGFAVRKNIWEISPFDESMLDSFHCYDIDFCLQIALKYRNYVYLKADITHFSNGNMDYRWIEQTLKMTDGKWSKMLPMCVPGFEPKNSKKIEARADYSFTFKAIRGRATKQQAVYILKKYVKKAIRSKLHRKNLFTILWQFVIKYHKLQSIPRN